MAPYTNIEHESYWYFPSLNIAISGGVSTVGYMILAQYYFNRRKRQSPARDQNHRSDKSSPIAISSTTVIQKELSTPKHIPNYVIEIKDLLKGEIIFCKQMEKISDMVISIKRLVKREIFIQLQEFVRDFSELRHNLFSELGSPDQIIESNFDEAIQTLGKIIYSEQMKQRISLMSAIAVNHEDTSLFFKNNPQAFNKVLKKQKAFLCDFKPLLIAPIRRLMNYRMTLESAEKHYAKSDKTKVALGGIVRETKRLAEDSNSTKDEFFSTSAGEERPRTASSEAARKSFMRRGQARRIYTPGTLRFTAVKPPTSTAIQETSNSSVEGMGASPRHNP